MKKFNILGSINPNMQNQPKMINIHLIDANTDNFFASNQEEERKRIDALAEEIIEVGFHSVIEVFEVYDRYMLIAGETRLNAMKTAFKKTNDPIYEFIPCFINENTDETVLRRRLIMDNVLQRTLTPALKMKAIEELQKTYEKEKAEGKRLPDRIQYLIAQDLDISKSQVGTYQKIIKNGSDSLKDKLKKDEITIESASKISSLSFEQQDKLLESTDGLKINVKNLKEHLPIVEEEQADIYDYMDDYIDEDYVESTQTTQTTKLHASITSKDAVVVKEIYDQLDIDVYLKSARTRLHSLSNHSIANRIEVKIEELQDMLKELLTELNRINVNRN